MNRILLSLIAALAVTCVVIAVDALVYNQPFEWIGVLDLFFKCFMAVAVYMWLSKSAKKQNSSRDNTANKNS